ncbi:MAG: nuclear transport factor 2 family protein, partial [Halioglobus sp.]|nr:nuclear transport factor 2 family protein [Halioglobus sp.]
MNTVELWHKILHERDMDRLDDLLADDCVFLSPVVHTPQKGRELTRLYLTAAFALFNDSFHYVKEVVTPRHAVLEFM